MRRRELMLALSAAVLAACQQEQTDIETPSADVASGAITDPAVVVRQIYDAYLADGDRPPSYRQAVPWSAQMTADLAAMDARVPAGESGPLEADPVIDGQDYALSDVSTVTDGVVEGSHAVVRASFTNIGERREVIYDLVWQDNRWKVDNIRTAQWDMRNIVTNG
ncbi:MAG: DUF3828 domain-containing protein [Hyphomonadaceae bacterium]